MRKLGVSDSTALFATQRRGVRRRRLRHHTPPRSLGLSQERQGLRTRPRPCIPPCACPPVCSSATEVYGGGRTRSN
jgi:hypothetical protein